jgi:predicted dehydrogenase
VRHLASKPTPAGFDLDLWLGPAPAHPFDPAYIPFHWRWFWDFGGGVLGDMACHHMDLPHWALGLEAPGHVEATGKQESAGDQTVPDVMRVDYRYPARGDRPAVHLTWYSGVPGPDLGIQAPYEGLRDGTLFEGTKGKLVADYGRYRLLPEAQFKDFVSPPRTIAPSIGHHREWLAAIRNGGATTCNFGYGGTLAETVLLGNVAYRCGKGFRWDERSGTADVPEAGAFLQREYRKGWSL